MDHTDSEAHKLNEGRGGRRVVEALKGTRTRYSFHEFANSIILQLIILTQLDTLSQDIITHWSCYYIMFFSNKNSTY